MPRWAVLLSLLFALAFPPPGRAAEPVITGGCAWIFRADPLRANLMLPDRRAVYWVTKFTYRENLEILVSGQYPHARYMSFNVYDQNGAPFSAGGAGSSLSDFQILPDGGSRNPYQTEGAEAGGAYSLVLRAHPRGTEPNELPIAPAGTPPGTEGYLILREFYGGGKGALPRLGYRLGADGAITEVPACRKFLAYEEKPQRQPVRCAEDDADCEAVRFFRPRQEEKNLRFPNADSAYLIAELVPPRGDRVFVVSGRAPNSPNGSEPPVWSAAQTEFDVRYWSMCNVVATPPYPLVVNALGPAGRRIACRSSDDTNLIGGKYVYVVGRESQRAAVRALRAKWPGLSFLPFSVKYGRNRHWLVLRNMLPAEGFGAAVQHVPEPATPAEAEAVMGEYYPRGALCSLERLRRSGPEACLAPDGSSGD